MLPSSLALLNNPILPLLELELSPTWQVQRPTTLILPNMSLITATIVLSLAMTPMPTQLV